MNPRAELAHELALALRRAAVDRLSELDRGYVVVPLSMASNTARARFEFEIPLHDPPRLVLVRVEVRDDEWPRSPAGSPESAAGAGLDSLEPGG